MQGRVPRYSKWGPRTSNISTTWEFVKNNPQSLCLFFSAIGLSDFRQHTCAPNKDLFSKSPLQRVVALWHEGSDICDFSEVSLKEHPFLLSAVWNTSLKAPSPAATLYHEMPLIMEATRGQTINRRDCVPDSVETLISPEWTTSQTPEFKKKGNVHFHYATDILGFSITYVQLNLIPADSHLWYIIISLKELYISQTFQ